MPVFFFTVEQQERAIVERFGKFVRVAGPGLQRKSPFVEKVAGRMSLQVEQLNADIETKTQDNVFVVVKLAIQYMVGADQSKVKDAFYKLDDPEVQMKSYAFDVVRSHIPTMDLDEAYADADTIAKHIQDTLQRQMADYGYEIIKALITNIEPDQRVKDAMNNINAARRNQEAATAQGEGDKTLRIKKAEAESESMRLHGEGVAAERKAIAQGLKDSLARDRRRTRHRPEGSDGAGGADPVHGHDPVGRRTRQHDDAPAPCIARRGRLVDGAGPRGHPHWQPRRGRRDGRRQRRGRARPHRRETPATARLSPKRDQSSGRDDGRPEPGHAGVPRGPGRPAAARRGPVNLPAAEQYHEPAVVTHKHDRLVAAGSVLTGASLIGGAALALYGGWEVLFNGGGAFGVVLAVIGILLAATHWGWVHVAEYVGVTIDERAATRPKNATARLAGSDCSPTRGSASRPPCSTMPRPALNASCIGRF